MTRRLCTEYVDPVGVEAIFANQLIPLDKGEGAVRPIGVGEVIRRVMGKCVMQVTKSDVIDASGSLQMCAGHKSGSEAAIHAMRNIFDADTTDAVLLVDASNAFNSLNRAAALHNIQVLCPSLATYVINTYRRPARLFIAGGEEVTSAEGTTQGDPIAMSLYAPSLQPLITQLHVSTEAKQCWFADDATGAGLLQDVRIWWYEFSDNGPALGYFPKAEKCWLAVKPDRKQAVMKMFRDTSINTAIDGHSHLGAALGSRPFLDEYVGEKVEGWVNEVTRLAEFAISQPQACYAAFTFGLRHRWTYFLRTLPDIQDLLEPLERAITDVLIPAVTDHTLSEGERELLSFPVRMGGLGFTNPVDCSVSQCEISVKVTEPLVKQIMEQVHQPPDVHEIRTVLLSTRKQKDDYITERFEQVKHSIPIKTKRAVELATEKGSSNWLTVIPLTELHYNLNRREFRDAVKLRYDWEIADMPTVCTCGDQFTVDHAMICRRGGFIIYNVTMSSVIWKRSC